MDSGFEAFCGAFWDNNLTINTENPDFTDCFQNSIAVWIPVGFLFLFTPVIICNVRYSQKPQLPWTLLLITKLVILLALLLLSAILFINSVIQLARNQFRPVSVLATALQLICVTYNLILVLLFRAKGVYSSGVVWTTWLLLAFCGIFQFRSLIMTNHSQPSQILFGTWMLYYPLVVVEFILFCFADTQSPAVFAGIRNPSPESYVSFPNEITFSYVIKIAYIGFRRALEKADLWDLLEKDCSRTLIEKWDYYWKPAMKEYNRKKATAIRSHTESRQSSKHYGSISDVSESEALLDKDDDADKDKTHPNQPIPPSIVWTIIKCSKYYILPALVFNIIPDITQFLNPIILERLISFVQSSDEPMWRGYIYAFGLLCVSIIYCVFMNQYYIRTYRLSMHIRSILVSELFTKALRMSNKSRRDYTIGEIVNHMSVDVQRFVDLAPHIGIMLSGPLEIILSLYFLYAQLGPSVFAGVAVMIMLIPVNGVLTSIQKRYQVKQMETKDERLKVVNEILNSMKVIKLYAWEPSFEQKVFGIRSRELKCIRKFLYLHAISMFIFLCAPFLISAASFATFVLSDPINNILTPQIAFVSITLFDIMSFPMSQMPQLFTSFVQAMVSNRRLNKFLTTDEIEAKHFKRLDAEGSVSVEVDKGIFAWEKGEAPILKNIDLNVPQQSIVAVVGQVGTGKSSLVSAILGEMDTEGGEVILRGSVAYVPQQAWIQNCSLRDNIIFGKEYNEDFYNMVIDACALKPDFEIFPAGDFTEIGEKGINLSGGQKQRVSLARAVYRMSDVYLLDDPLSAVDSHVGKHIFKEVIGRDGLLKNKTRILVTHHLIYLKEVDQIIVMKHGRISEIGTYDELISSEGAFSEVLEQYQNEQYEEGSDSIASSASPRLFPTSVADEGCRYGRQYSQSSSRITSPQHHRFSPEQDALELFGDDQMDSHESLVAKSHISRIQDNADETVRAKQIEEETAEIGNIKFEVYRNYLKAIGYLPSILIILTYIAANAFKVSSNVWLSEWSNDVDDATVSALGVQINNTFTTIISVAVPKTPVGTRLAGYLGLGLGLGVFTLAGSTFVSFFAVMASGKLHKDLFHNLMRSPMSFFDVTPIGRIVNRCGKDVDTVDTTLPKSMPGTLNCFMEVIANILVIIITTPIFAIIAVPMAVIYYFIQRIYVATSRQIRRLESLSRSPIYSHFQETIQGASSIRAYQVAERFIRESEAKVDENNKAYYALTVIADRWLALYMLMIGNFISFFAALFAVMSRGTLSPGLAGLSISNALNVTQLLNWAVRQASEVETNIVSVERIKEYTDTPTEAEWEIEETKPKSDWPNKGNVVLNDCSVRYRPGLDLVLKSINCNISGSEKIGIAGRTGAGKSSLTLCLFRLVEPASGNIIVDGIDISTLGLHSLRSRLTIIPQDPVLFSGSLRFNLDPFNSCTDAEIWRALEHSHLRNFVASLPQKLDYAVCEGGENLSVGQRQLVCLARALLRNTKVLVLDEATAAVDMETDDLIQETIRKEFSDCTILTIAHRLNTILDSTRVMVLDKGKIVEFEPPNQLLGNKKSVFYGMAKDAGLVS